MNQAKTTSITENSPYAYLKRGEGIIITKTNTCNGDGAQTDNLFTITGTVDILAIWGVCTEATNATDLADNSLAVYDGTLTLELTDSGIPTNCSGMIVGDVVFKNGGSSGVALAYQTIATGVLTDLSQTKARVSKKSGVATYIQHLFNGDVDTDVDIKWYVQYVPVSDDGAISAT